MPRASGSHLSVVQRANGSAAAESALSDFDWFWSEYPKHKAKGDAFKAWQQTAAIRPPIEQIIAAIDTQAKSNDWQKEGGQYIPLPATWLRAWRWDDG